jgi:tetratricopeptide (TPR) repeat protein
VRKSGNQLRVSAQLVNAADGFNLWSRTWDRELADVFTIQQELTSAVTTALSVTLGAGEFAIPGMTRNIEAYDMSLQAQALYNEFTPDNVFRALNLMEEALKLDPAFGRGWLQLGNMYDDSRLILSSDQSVEFPALAANAFNKAREAAPDMPELLLVEANIERGNANWLEAQHLYERFFREYGNSSAMALEEFGTLQAITGQLQAAIATMERARRLEPLSPRYTYQVALHNLYADNFAAVLQEAETGKSLEGGSWLFNALYWQVAMKQDELMDASRQIRDYYASNPDVFDATASRAFMLKLADILANGDFEASSEEIIKLINDPGVSPLEMGYVARLVALMEQPAIALDYWYGVPLTAAIWDSVYAEMRALPDFIDLLQARGVLGYWENSGNRGDFCQVQADTIECR